MPEQIKAYECYIGIGSNMGNREANIKAAVERIGGHQDVEIVKMSSIYETAPWGDTMQSSFLNAVLQLRSKLTPNALLKFLLQQENEMGRVRKKKWGPRIIDLDILHIVGIKSDTEELTLPHPYFQQRAFALIPWCEIDSGLIIENKSIKEYCVAVEDKDGVKLYKKNSG